MTAQGATVLLFLLSTLLFSPTQGASRVIGYFTNWSQYRDAGDLRYQFLPEKMDATLFSHLGFAFLTINTSNQAAITYPNDADLMARFHQVARTQNPNIKTFASFGGYNAGAAQFSTMVSSAGTRSTFIQSAISFARQYDFDGVEISWQFPALESRGGNTDDKENLSTFLSEFRSAIESEVIPSGKSKLLLSLMASSFDQWVSAGYQPWIIHSYVDWITVMTFDMLGWNYELTSPHTAIYNNALSISHVFESLWIDVPSDKLVLFISSYGRTFTLQSSSQTGFFSSATGRGQARLFTDESGFASLYELTLLQQDPWTTTVFDSSTSSMYLYNNLFWVTYDSPATAQLKVDYAASNYLGGIGVWSTALDDIYEGLPFTTAVVDRVCAYDQSSTLCQAHIDSISLLSGQDLILATPNQYKARIKLRLPVDAGVTSLTLWTGNSTHELTLLGVYSVSPTYQNQEFVELLMCNPLDTSTLTDTHLHVFADGASGVLPAVAMILDRATPTDTVISIDFTGTYSAPGVQGQVLFRRNDTFADPFITAYTVFTATDASEGTRTGQHCWVESSLASDATVIFSCYVSDATASFVHVVSVNYDGMGCYAWLNVSSSQTGTNCPIDQTSTAIDGDCNFDAIVLLAAAEATPTPVPTFSTSRSISSTISTSPSFSPSRTSPSLTASPTTTPRTLSATPTPLSASPSPVAPPGHCFCTDCTYQTSGFCKHNTDGWCMGVVGSSCPSGSTSCCFSMTPSNTPYLTPTTSSTMAPSPSPTSSVGHTTTCACSGCSLGTYGNCRHTNDGTCWQSSGVCPAGTLPCCGTASWTPSPTKSASVSTSISSPTVTASMSMSPSATPSPSQGHCLCSSCALQTSGVCQHITDSSCVDMVSGSCPAGTVGCCASNSPSPSPTSGFTTVYDSTCSPNQVEIVCDEECCSSYHWCVGSYRYPSQPTATGTRCKNGVLVHEGLCAGVTCSSTTTTTKLLATCPDQSKCIPLKYVGSLMSPISRGFLVTE